jgi:alpha-tubulin suppressor-like RCC1 family protein
MALQDDINNFSCSNTATELLVLAAQTANTTEDRIVSVANIGDLPDLKNNTVIPGTVVYVEDIQTPVIAQIGCWTTLDNRELRNDTEVGSIWAWGSSASGQLGNKTDSGNNTSSPVRILTEFSDWCCISSGTTFGVGLRCNGTIWTWGSNSGGQLGTGNTIDRSAPVSVIGEITDWCFISACSVAAAIRSNGSLWVWGSNPTGRLGTGDTVDRLSPVSVIGGFTDWCQAVLGGHSHGVRSNGTLWGWGSNGQGRLGNGTTIASSSPVSVVGGFTDWCQVSLHAAGSIGLRQNGTLWGWGRNQYGRLGTGDTVDRSSPVSVIGGFTDWCQVAAGGFGTTAIRSNGTLWAWGARPGDGTSITRSSPVSVIGGFTDWCQVKQGYRGIIALRQNGTAWGWGNNGDGRLGVGDALNRSSPTSVVGGITDWIQVDQGDTTTYAIRKF